MLKFLSFFYLVFFTTPPHFHFHSPTSWKPVLWTLVRHFSHRNMKLSEQDRRKTTLSLSLSLSLYVGMWVSVCGEALNYNNNNNKMNGPLWCVSEREFGQKVKVKLWNHVLPNALCCESCDWCTLKSVIILCFSLSHVVTCSPSQASFVYTFLIQTVLSFLFKDSCVPRHNF